MSEQQVPEQIRTAGGAAFELYGDNPVERALLESEATEADHVWEPQTTRVLCALAAEGGDVLVGGAFIGDQALLAARHAAGGARVHAFEPMPEAFRRLERNIELSAARNVVAHRAALWDSERPRLSLRGELALAETREAPPGEGRVAAVTIDSYVAGGGARVGVIALDLEGAELRALHGAKRTLASSTAAPHVIFEIHRSHVDWSDGLERTEPVRLVRGHGYEVFAIRDYQGNVAMPDRTIELVPVHRVHLEGPPHGFNLLATRDSGLPGRLGARIVRDVSPKLLDGRGPLHAPAT